MRPLPTTERWFIQSENQALRAGSWQRRVGRAGPDPQPGPDLPYLLAHHGLLEGGGSRVYLTGHD